MICQSFKIYIFDYFKQNDDVFELFTILKKNTNITSIKQREKCQVSGLWYEIDIS